MKHAPESFIRLVDALEQLPAIGRKSAMRLAYHMVMQESLHAMKIAHAIEEAVGALRKCRRCGAMSEDELCDICSDDRREQTLLCIVEHPKDILTIEENGLFEGHYYVLDTLERLDVGHLQNVVAEGVKEVIFALTPSSANDFVIHFIEERLEGFDVRFTRIAQGVPTGVSLENIDMVSLSRALTDRVQI